MISEELKTQIEALTDDQKAKVADFVTFLLWREENKRNGKYPNVSSEVTGDFNTTLEEFTDYMLNVSGR